MSVFYSIIIPAYNASTPIVASLHSVTCQLFTDYEIIIVDDGSTDKTKEIVAGFTGNRISYFYQSNQGVCAARNYGSVQANGKYLIFLDADDRLSADHLRSFYDLLQSKHYRLALGLISFFDKHQSLVKCIKPWKSKLGFSQSLPGAFIIDADLFKKLDGYDARLTYSENSDLFLRLDLGGLVSLNEIVLNLSEGVNKDIVDVRERNARYARKKLESASYFLEKHKSYLTTSVKDYRNFKRTQAISALQLGEISVAKKCLLELIKRDPYSIKTFLQFFFIYFMPKRARNHYS